MAVTSPQITMDEYLNEDMDLDMLVNAMVGDLQRIKEYPARGFQVRNTGQVPLFALSRRISHYLVSSTHQHTLFPFVDARRHSRQGMGCLGATRGRRLHLAPLEIKMG